MKSILLGILLFYCTGSHAQILKKIKDRVEGKAKGEVNQAK